MHNKGFDPEEIELFRKKLTEHNLNYEIVETEDNSNEYVNFRFIGQYDGKDVIYDAVIYTLRLQHNSEIFEIAEKKASERFPEFTELNYSEDENGDYEELDDLEEEIGLFMAEVMMDLEEEEAVKVQEHVEVDRSTDYGIGLDIGLNIEEVNPQTIMKFIKDYNSDSLLLDTRMYSFQHEAENEE